MRQKSFTLLELPVITSLPQLDAKRTEKIKAERVSFSPAFRQVKLYSFTLIELLVVQGLAYPDR